ncbi:MAG TPA: sulfurtransferase [Rudaea sp.]|nr:sulfurtransferase [Rudaea sp.]
MTTRTIVSAVEAERLARAGALVVDCRFELPDPERGARDYAAGHVPGAVYADLNRDLSDLAKTGLGRHPLPDAAAFSRVLGRFGWRPGTTVIAYDDAGGALAAARLWWMLRLVGERDVAVLDGGFAAWKAAGLPLETDVPRREPTDVSVRFDDNAIVGTAALQQLLQNPQCLVVDARGAARYRGETEPIDRVAGHVPGARNRPFSDNLGTDGRFKPAAELRADFERLLGAGTPDDVVHMCGSGVTACHNLLAMEHAGLAGARVYAPSWSGWIADPNRPVATGA